MLIAGDALCLLLPLFIAVTGGRADLDLLFADGGMVEFGLVVALAVLLALAASLHDVGRATCFWKTHRATVCAGLVVLASRLFHSFGRYPELSHERYLFETYAILAVGTWRTLFYLASKVLPLSRRTLIIGAGVTGNLLADSIAQCNDRGENHYRLVGFVDDDPAKQGLVYCGSQVLGRSRDVGLLVDRHRVDIVALAVNREPVLADDVFAALLTSRERGVRVASMPTLYEEINRRVPVTHVGHNWGVVFPVEHVVSPYTYDATARILDVLVGLVGCVIALALSPLLALANRWGDSCGPLLYSQLRVGKGGRLFRIYKFRSMVVNAEASGAVWCQEDDPRITRVGCILRKTRLDELPQFWNLLVGDMSLIGPRPERPEFVDTLSESIPFYRARHAVKPGLTGWAQVMYRYGASEQDALIKLQYDLYYIKHRSTWINLVTLAKSLKIVLGAAGR